MKYIFYFTLAALLSGCSGKSGNDPDEKRPVAVSSITSDMGCENCGMNLKKYISTVHAIKMKDGASHFYCSINCSTAIRDSLGTGADSVFAMDFNSTIFVYAPEAYYVIGSSLKGTMTSVSKFTFSSINDAESFSRTFKGKEIVDYQTAFEMSKEEILKRRNQD